MDGFQFGLNRYYVVVLFVFYGRFIDNTALYSDGVSIRCFNVNLSDCRLVLRMVEFENSEALI